jgi:hypothetical protein
MTWLQLEPAEAAMAGRNKTQTTCRSVELVSCWGRPEWWAVMCSDDLAAAGAGRSSIGRWAHQTSSCYVWECDVMLTAVQQLQHLISSNECLCVLYTCFISVSRFVPMLLIVNMQSSLCACLLLLLLLRRPACDCGLPPPPGTWLCPRPVPCLEL